MTEETILTEMERLRQKRKAEQMTPLGVSQLELEMILKNAETAELSKLRDDVEDLKNQKASLEFMQTEEGKEKLKKLFRVEEV